jgi:hypothetical protein
VLVPSSWNEAEADELRKFARAVDVPTNNLPAESILKDSTPPSVKAIVSAAGEYMPVLLSPVNVILGAEAEPAALVTAGVLRLSTPVITPAPLISIDIRQQSS